MNKKELIDIIADKQNITKKEAEAVVEAVFDTIIDSVLSGDKVLISGFGTFRVHQRDERRGVSPKTKESIVIPASKTLTFKPSNNLKDSMNQ